MNHQPLGDRLIVEVLDEEQETVSGIVLPDTAKTLEWSAFLARFFPNRGRHDFAALKAYGASRHALVGETPQCVPAAESSREVLTWESEGGAPAGRQAD